MPPSAAYDHVRSLCSPLSPPVVPVASAPITPANQPAPVKKMKLDTRAAALKFIGIQTPTVPAVSEFDRYISTPAEADTDALAWWSENHKLFPTVADVARGYLSMPATSVLSERQFSAAGRLVSKLRSRLEPERIDTIMFLYKNM